MRLCRHCCKLEFWPLSYCIMKIWPDFKRKGKLLCNQTQLKHCACRFLKCNPVRFWPLGGFLYLPCFLVCTHLPFTQPELKQFSLLAILSCHQAMLINKYYICWDNLMVSVQTSCQQCWSGHLKSCQLYHAAWWTSTLTNAHCYL